MKPQFMIFAYFANNLSTTPVVVPADAFTMHVIIHCQYHAEWKDAKWPLSIP